MSKFYKDNFAWLLPIALIFVITPFTPYIDLAVTKYFYDPNQGFSSHPFYTFMYKYGPLPADITTAGAIIVFMASYISKKFKNWRHPALVLILTMGIGSGIFIHGILKDHWGRPRPKQVIEFGGTQSFRPYYHPNIFNQPEPSKSFTCGHCSVGFYFFALALIGRSLRNRLLFWSGLILTLFLGVSLSVTRIAQGGHFVTDILFSALIMWITAYVCTRLLLTKNKESS